MQDPNWKRGFVGADCWRLWGELMIGLIPGTPKSITNCALEFEDIEELLKNFQQQAQNRQMDPRDWIWQTFAYDAHDLADVTKGLTTEQVLQSIQIPVLIIGVPGDLYNPTEEACNSASLLSNGRYLEIQSFLGHAAASERRAEDAEFLNREISHFLVH